MPCYSPITLKNPSKIYQLLPGLQLPDMRGKMPYVAVPCGKCIGCLQRYQNDWQIRLTYESLNWKHIYFITLTYSPSTVPCTGLDACGNELHSVYKPDVVNWFKRGREKLRKDGYSFKYFLTSEYGPKTLRPHYHLMLFTDAPKFLVQSSLCHDWKIRFGFYQCRELSKFQDGASRYVAKYCSKGMFENPLVRAKKVDKTFHLVSNGLGENYVALKRSWHLGYRDIFRRGSMVSWWKPNTGTMCLFRETTSDYDKLLVDRYCCYLDTPRGRFRYAMPKYYKDRIYKQKYKYTDYENGNKKKTAFRPTEASRRLSRALLRINDDLYRQQLGKIQSAISIPSDLPPSENEASYHLVHSQIETSNAEMVERLVRLDQFYQKSKL